MACLGREQIMGIFDWLEKVGRANLPCLATLKSGRGSDCPGGPTSLGRRVRFRATACTGTQRCWGATPPLAEGFGSGIKIRLGRLDASSQGAIRLWMVKSRYPPPLSLAQATLLGHVTALTPPPGACANGGFCAREMGGGSVHPPSMKIAPVRMMPHIFLHSHGGENVESRRLLGRAFLNDPQRPASGGKKKLLAGKMLLVGLPLPLPSTTD